MKKSKASPLFLLILFLLIVIYTNMDISRKYILMMSLDDVNITSILEKQHYEISSNSKSKNLYIGLARKNTMNFKKYAINNGETLKLNIPKDQKLIISLANDIKDGDLWNVENTNQMNCLLFIEKEHCLITPAIAFENYSKNQLDREVFFFEINKEGKETIKFKYGNNDELLFDFKLEIEVE